MDNKLRTDPNISDAVTKLRTHFKPLKIYLFGSQAKGTANDDSDYDFLVVIENSEKTLPDRMIEANHLLKGRKYPVDIFVYTKQEFDESKEEFGSIAYLAITEGLEF